MKLVSSGALVAAFVIFAVSGANAAPLIFVVRHAEKAAGQGNDPELSPAGQKRATALAQMLNDAQLTAIFTTEFKRTQQTAAPTAKETQITPATIPGNDIAGLVAKLRQLKGNALVVGHSNTVPEVVKAFGIQGQVKIQDDDYTELFIITLTDTPQLLQLHYSP